MQEFIPIGRENAISSAHLALRMGYKDDRALRNKIYEMREHGIPVCSENSGYFLPQDRDEARHCIARLRQHGLKELAMAAAIEKAVADLPGQIGLDG